MGRNLQLCRETARFHRGCNDHTLIFLGHLIVEVPAETWKAFPKPCEQFVGSIAGAAGLDGLYCLLQYLFGLGL
jgi:hypothetical protein